MKAVMILTLIGAFALLAGCDQGVKKDGGIVVQRADEAAPAAQSAAAPAAEAEAESAAPSSVTLASGVSVPVVEVPTLDADPAKYAGEVAIFGKVEAVYADRGAFTLVDCRKMAGCASDCCSPAQVPLAVPPAEFEGELPAVDAEVVVIGKLTPAETGYSFDVHEVRQGETVLLSPKDTVETTDA